MWEDPGDWPRAYPGTAEQLALGVYIAGQDMHDHVQRVSWVAGTDNPLSSSLPLGSASVTLRETAPAVANGDRLVILTEYDVLFTGRLESTSTDEIPNEPVVTEVTASDDLSRAGNAEISLWLTGILIGEDIYGGEGNVLRKILDAAYVPADIVDDRMDYSASYEGGYAYASPVTHAGAALQILSDAIYYAGCIGSYTPSGLRVRNRGRWVDSAQAVALEDARTAATSWSTARNVSDVINQITGTYASLTRYAYPAGVDPVITFEDGTIILFTPESRRAYGPRAMSLYDLEEWPFRSTGETYLMEAILDPFAVGDFDQPFARIRARYNVEDTDDTAQRLIPFDRVQQDSDDYLVLRISQSVDLDSWSVEANMIEVDAIAEWWDKYDYFA